MRYFLNIFIAVSALVLTSCGPGPYDMAFKPVMDAPTPAGAYLLDKGARPRLIFSEEIEDDLKIFTDQNFAVVGESFFNGPAGDTDDALNVARKLKVTHVLLTAKYLYAGSKKAYKFYENFDYIPYIDYYNGQPRYMLERIANPISVPYRKEVSIYNHRAIYLVKLR